MLSPSISPFSIVDYQWQAKYQIIKSAELHYIPRLIYCSKEEIVALKALRDIGVIGSSQFRSLFFDGNKEKVKKMIREKKILEHEFEQRRPQDGTTGTDGSAASPKKTLHFYTLGLSAFGYFDNLEEVNYWYGYTEADILQRLAFFKLFSNFRHSNPVIYKGKQPFVGTIDMFEPIDVLVIKNNTREIQQEWRYKEPDPDRRMIILTENLNWLKPMNDLLAPCKARVALESDLGNPIQDIFYVWNEEKKDWIPVGE